MRARRPTPAYRGKRALDLVLTTCAAPLLLPLGLLVALAVRLRLGRPVLFRQYRPGLDGELFAIVKFRTMTDARGPDGELLDDEVRLTRFGRLLRSTSLDELPELCNVWRGEMSLVGPRPLMPEYLPRYSPRQATRHRVRPGVTGLAQVSGRNALSWEDRLELDAHYVEHCGWRLDLSILYRTVSGVVRRDGIAADGHATMTPFLGSAPAVVGEVTVAASLAGAANR